MENERLRMELMKLSHKTGSTSSSKPDTPSPHQILLSEHTSGNHSSGERRRAEHRGCGQLQRGEGAGCVAGGGRAVLGRPRVRCRAGCGAQAAGWRGRQHCSTTLVPPLTTTHAPPRCPPTGDYSASEEMCGEKPTMSGGVSMPSSNHLFELVL